LDATLANQIDRNTGNRNGDIADTGGVSSAGEVVAWSIPQWYAMAVLAREGCGNSHCSQIHMKKTAFNEGFVQKFSASGAEAGCPIEQTVQQRAIATRRTIAICIV
jgi:hypothetical protein